MLILSTFVTDVCNNLCKHLCNNQHGFPYLPCWQVLQPGEGLVALNQSANRDEDVFEQPDKFDINR